MGVGKWGGEGGFEVFGRIHLFLKYFDAERPIYKQTACNLYPMCPVTYVTHQCFRIYIKAASLIITEGANGMMMVTMMMIMISIKHSVRLWADMRLRSLSV